LKRTIDQGLTAFSLGELSVASRLFMRVRLASSAKLRRRLAEVQLTSGAIASALAPQGRIAFHANLALKLRRLAMIDLCIGLFVVAVGIRGGAYALAYFTPPKTLPVVAPCPTPDKSSKEAHSHAHPGIKLEAKTTASP
jgi:hypothetical protein